MRRTKTEALETREALLDAAETVFYEKGVSATSLTDIATAASLTRGAIYWHFEDKAALFEAMQRRGRLPQEHVSKLLYASECCDPLKVVHQLAVEGLRYLVEDRRSQRVCTIMLLRCEYIGEMGEALKRLQVADDELCAAVRGAYRKAEERGLLSPDWTAESAALAHIATMTGLITQWLRCDGAFDLLEVGEPMLKSLMKGFARPGAIDRPVRSEPRIAVV